jgi:hypothetical protein
VILIPVSNSLRYGPKISAISPPNFSKASNIYQLSESSVGGQKAMVTTAE